MKRSKGTLVDWRDDRGYGFIEPAASGKRVFCHIRAFTVRVKRPISGDRVTYLLATDKQGRPQATDVRPLGLEDAKYRSATRKPKSRSHSNQPPLIRAACVTIFFAVLVGLEITAGLSWYIPIAYVVMSIITMLAYASDKSAAMNKRRRTQEQSLHLMEIAGGWPGAWLAQSMLRHKHRKASFMVEFWICTLINIGLLTWYTLTLASA
ncbi:MAG: cold shock and DUF1294 domain-containing protein [Steroidobacteraceae bacterium]